MVEGRVSFFRRLFRGDIRIRVVLEKVVFLILGGIGEDVYLLSLDCGLWLIIGLG